MSIKFTAITDGETSESSPTKRTAQVGCPEGGAHWPTQEGSPLKELDVSTSSTPEQELSRGDLWLAEVPPEVSGLSETPETDKIDLALIQSAWYQPFATRGDLARSNPERLASLAERGLMSVRDILNGSLARHWRPTALGLMVLRANGRSNNV